MRKWRKPKKNPPKLMQNVVSCAVFNCRAVGVKYKSGTTWLYYGIIAVFALATQRDPLSEVCPVCP